MISATTSGLSAEYERILADVGEIACLAHYSRACGSKSLRVFDSVGTFEEWLAALPPLTWIEVFRTYEMPTRGTIDDAFIQHVDLIVPGSADYIVADMSTTGDLRGTDDRAELLEYLEDWRGRLVAVGIWPPRSGKEEDVLDIVIPNHDGTIVPGVY